MLEFKFTLFLMSFIKKKSLNLHLYSYVYSLKKRERELTVLKDTVSLKQDAESPLNTNLSFVYENLHRWILP